MQHLAPDHKSMLTELIRRCTRMQVFEVEDGMAVRPNCVYIIPPGRDMAFLNGALQLLEPAEPRGQRLPLPFAKVATDVEEQVTLRRLIPERHQQVCCERAGTASDLQDYPTTQLSQGRANQAGKAPGEDRAEFRRCDEVAPRPELPGTGTVVAESRRVEDGVHVVSEAQEAATGGDARCHQVPDPCAVRESVGPGRRQIESALHGGVILTAVSSLLAIHAARRLFA